jgi:hypothetical protein
MELDKNVFNYKELKNKIFWTKFWIIKPIGFNMPIECKETNFPDYQKITSHMDYGTKDDL